MAKVKHGKDIQALINQQMRLWETMAHPQQVTALRESTAPKIGPYITVSRLCGTAGDDIARRVAEHLGWQLFDRELVEYIASESRVRQEIVSLFDEKVQNELHTWVENLITFSSMDGRHYLKKLSEVIYAIARHGNAVIVGRGANFIVPPGKGLRVRIVAPISWRLQHLQRREHLTPEEAKKKIEQQDEMQRSFIRKHFHRELDDSTAYDMVLNVASFGVEYCVQLIVAGVLKLRGDAAPGE